MANKLTGLILLDKGLKPKGRAYSLVVTNESGDVLKNKTVWGIGDYVLTSRDLIARYKVGTFNDRGAVFFYNVTG